MGYIFDWFVFRLNHIYYRQMPANADYLRFFHDLFIERQTGFVEVLRSPYFVSKSEFKEKLLYKIMINTESNRGWETST